MAMLYGNALRQCFMAMLYGMRMEEHTWELKLPQNTEPMESATKYSGTKAAD